MTRNTIRTTRTKNLWPQKLQVIIALNNIKISLSSFSQKTSDPFILLLIVRTMSRSRRSSSSYRFFSACNTSPYFFKGRKLIIVKVISFVTSNFVRDHTSVLQKEVTAAKLPFKMTRQKYYSLVAVTNQTINFSRPKKLQYPSTN